MYIAKRKYNTSYDLYMCGNKKKEEEEAEQKLWTNEKKK